MQKEKKQENTKENIKKPIDKSDLPNSMPISEPDLKLSEKIKLEIMDLAVTGFQIEEVAEFLDLSKDLIEPFYKKGLFLRKEKLLKLQWEKAEAGDGNLQIHLGRHLLGQHERTENVHEIVTLPYSDLPRDKLLEKVDQLRLTTDKTHD